MILQGDDRNRTGVKDRSWESADLQGFCRLPITGVRDRRIVVVGHALIDAEDRSRLARYRWHLINGRHVGRRPVENGVEVKRFLHREVMGLAADDPRRVDHINRDTLDNRRANLRLATGAQNAQNQGSRGGSSSYRGVTWDRSRGKWMATAMLDGRRRTIGRFASEDEAAAAVSAWRARHMPFSDDARFAA